MIKKHIKNFIFWALAVIITLSAIVFQRMTGPTNSKNVNFELSGKEYATRLTRSLETSITLEEAKGDYNILGRKVNLEIEIPGSSNNMKVNVCYKRYHSNDTIMTVSTVKNGDIYSLQLPAQPPAGKIVYFAVINDGVNSTSVGKDENIIIRFKNHVPAWVLVPHIFLMFLAMLLSTYTGILALAKSKKTGIYALLVIITLGLGGLIFGPIVQKYAFGAYWTGWPFGEDLTDTKTLVGFVLWFAAWLGNRYKNRWWLYIAASVTLLLVYSIPHSTAGSEYSYEKRSVVTGVSINTCESQVYRFPRC